MSLKIQMRSMITADAPTIPRRAGTASRKQLLIRPNRAYNRNAIYTISRAASRLCHHFLLGLVSNIYLMFLVILLLNVEIVTDCSKETFYQKHRTDRHPHNKGEFLVSIYTVPEVCPYQYPNQNRNYDGEYYKARINDGSLGGILQYIFNFGCHLVTFCARTR